MAPRPPRRDALRDPAPPGAGSPVSSPAIPLAALALVLALSAALPITARAEERTDGPTVSLELGAAALRFDYAERDPAGGLLDRETGWLPAVELRAAVAAGRLFAAATGRLAAGSVGYEGTTQSSSPATDGLPVTSTTRTDLAQAQVEAGAWLDPDRRVGLCAGAAARRWGRGIRPTTVVSRSGATVPVSGLRETYDWKELQAGLRLAAVRGAGVELELGATLFEVLAPRMAVDWYGERVVLDLGARPGWRLGAALRIGFAPRWRVALEGTVERYRFGASGIDPATSILEPASETTSLALAARLGATF